ncbi:SDR family oxidoreductase [Dactylosporangium siamense]|uniref:NAD(P)-dependent oxidoreductase n=1 Tax=Dactylosporangium siamense TaxID=685454 RepID=A0A919PK56_9ACTN|nr:SDR family oxidoreductase [Dactylosporangium siamense]GIG43970.1 NAD(P)-dependent oxidoreductase [Dactylosporangium siamense]
MTRILVTGATGAVGANVIHELRARGADVRAFVRDPRAAAAKLGDVELVPGDFDDPASLRRALHGVDRVYVSAADGPRKVAHETAVIDAAAEEGVDRIVKLSAMHAEESSALPAFRWHGEVEAHLRRSGLAAVVLRPAFFMTNLLMVAGGVAHTGLLHAPTAGRRIAMIDIRDVAAVAAATLVAETLPGRSYDLTGPAAITFADVAAALGDATGRPVRSVDLTEEEARPRFEGADVPDWLGTHLAGVFGVIRAGGFERTTDQVRALTGRPARDISGFARDFAAAFTPQGAPA